MRGRKVGIIGAGRSGVAAARLARDLGASVLISDQENIARKLPSGIASESGGHSKRLLASHLIIRSPGVPSHLPILKACVRRGIPIWSELELASRYLKPRCMVAITGTNGKTTTTTLVGELFKAHQADTIVAGNIGTPLSDYALRIADPSFAVIEVSSYQLEDVETFHPQLSAILNITPDHLEHHGTMRAYAAAKARIFENQTESDVCVLNADDLGCQRLARQCRARILFFSRTQPLASGVYWSKGKIHVRWGEHRFSWSLKTNLPGPHNVENVLAAVALAVAGGIPEKKIRRVLQRFRGVEHRLEWVRSRRGVRFINDSKATNVDSTRVALQSFSEPLVLILGGEGKGSPYAPLRALIRDHVKSILLIGEDTPTIEKELKGIVPMERTGRMSRAVRRAAELATRGDVVLLSPACASFDQYNNYEERGRDYKAQVHKLK